MSVVIIGAGWYGVAAAKAYLELDPNVDLVLFDEASSLGGVWGSSRIYPGLVADSPTGLFEFSDFRLSEEVGLEQWSDIPGDKVRQYLELYARKYGVLQRCRFGTKVIKAQEHHGGWNIYTRHVSGQPNRENITYCDKLIVATGITSRPSLPVLPFATFNGRILHSQDLGKQHGFLTSGSVQSVVVVGANKSALEAVSICAFAGKQVTWLIRKGGRGPGALHSTRNEKGMHPLAANSSRWSNTFDPGVYSTRSWLHRFLYSGQHQSGSWLCERHWKSKTAAMLQKRGSAEGQKQLLTPDTNDSFWPIGNSSYMHDNEKKLMDMIDEGKLIRIVREEIVTLGGDSVTLSNGQAIQAEAVVFATGWTLSHNAIFDDKTAIKLGLPSASGFQEPSETAYWQNLHTAACDEVFKMYPVLRNPPRQARCQDQTPFRLFRTIAPPKFAAAGKNSIAFVGILSNKQVSTHAEISGLWTAAYLTGSLYTTSVGKTLKDQSSMDHDVATMNAFVECRYLGRKGRIPDAELDVQGYIDVMMRDMGLRTDRKRLSLEGAKSHGWFGVKGWWREWFSPYLPQDYAGARQEYSRLMRVETGKEAFDQDSEED